MVLIISWTTDCSIVVLSEEASSYKPYHGITLINNDLLDNTMLQVGTLYESPWTIRHLTTKEAQKACERRFLLLYSCM